MADMDKTECFRGIYFSGTGNTEWVMERIRAGLEGEGCECLIMSADKILADCGLEPGKEADEDRIRAALEQFLDEADTLIYAFPTYGSDVPDPLKRLNPLFPKGNRRKIAVVSTVKLFGGDALQLPEKYFREKGYNPVLSAYVKMPNNLKIPKFDFFEIENGEQLKPYYETAGKTVDKIIKSLASGKPGFEGRRLSDLLGGYAQRLGEPVFKKFVVSHLFADARCIKCRLCAATCPMANIDFSHGYPDFGKNCCVCMRCYNFCPVNAVHVTEKTMDRNKYGRYKGFDGWKPPKLREIKPPGKDNESL